MGARSQESEQAAKGSHRDIDKDKQSPLAGVEHGVKDDKDDENRNRKHQHEPPRRTFLTGVLSGPVDLVAGGQLYLRVDLADRLLHRTAKIAVADAVLDGYVTLASLAVDLFGTVFGLGRGELGKRNALTRRREESNVIDGFLGAAELGQIADDDIVASLALQNLGDCVSADSGLDCVLDVGDVDAVACGCLAIDGVVEVWLTDDTKQAEILDALDLA